MHGIINVYKPCGMSSNFVLTLLKKQLNIKKMGHLGTLDPLACGVLPVMINKGTKLFNLMLTKTKVYRAVFTFGKETDTLDSEGKIIKTSNNIPSVNEIETQLHKLTGNILQLPPNFSAKSVNGERAYNLARKGISVNLTPKNVFVESFNLIKQINKNSFLFEIKCSSGTYIRSLARDLGALLNSCAFMSALIRISSNEFNILNSTVVFNLTKDNIFDKLIKFDALFKDYKKLILNNSYYKKVTNGVKIKIEHEDCKKLVVYCNNELIGLGEVLNNELIIKTNLQG